MLKASSISDTPSVCEVLEYNITGHDSIGIIEWVFFPSFINVLDIQLQNVGLLLLNLDLAFSSSESK